jgi:hypothetical protein
MNAAKDLNEFRIPATGVYVIALSGPEPGGCAS